MKESIAKGDLSELGKAAEEWAGQGFFVFPTWWTNRGGVCACPGRAACEHPGKHPLTKHGFKDATRDPSQIGRWWRRWPNANVAIDCERSGIIALDFDKATGGDAAFWALIDRFGLERFGTRKHHTPGNGFHLLYRDQGRPIPSSQGKILEGLDVKSRGGYVLAPPSRNNGRAYTVDPEQIEMLLFPDVLRAFFTEHTSSDTGAKARFDMPEQIVHGTRHSTLLSWAGLVRDRGMTGAEILATLRALNGRCIDGNGRPDPLNDDELANLANDVATRYASTRTLEGKSAAALSDETAWPELTAPNIPKLSVPMLPRELLPAPLAPWIIDEAERMNVPLEAIAIPVMIALGSVLGCGVAIQPSWGNEGYLALASTWGTVIAPPGSTKTPAMNAALAPLYDLQRKAREQYRNDNAAMEARRKNLVSDLDDQRAKLRVALRRKNSPDTPSLTATIRTKEAELAALSVDERVYLLNDATIEALGVVCAQNPRGILLGSDEIVRPFKSWEKPGHEPDRAFMLSGWQGVMPYDGRRISRHVPYIERFSIAIYGGAQPGVMRDYIEAAQGAKAGNDGLVQRLQLAVWPDMLPDFDKKAEENVKRDPDYTARAKAFCIFERLAQFDAMKYGARLVNGIPVLRFAPEAQELFDDFRRELEHRVRKDDELLGNEPLANHLTKYRSLMPGLALAAHLASEADTDDYGNRVSLGAAQIGIGWCTIMEPHARKLYAGGSGEAAYNPSERLCDAIDDRAITDGMALRNIYRWHWRGLDTLDRLKAALAPLAAANWTRIEMRETGGHPSEVLRLHPRLRRA